MQRLLAQGCYLCGARHHGHLLCPGCTGDLVHLDVPHCPVCGMPTAEGAICGACLKSPPSFDRVVAVYRYAFPVSVLVQRLKYAGDLAIAPWLADRLAETVDRSNLPDVIVPMPLHDSRLRTRGFNQAALIGKRLASTLGVAIDLAACRRVRATLPQVELPYRQRRGNLRGAFRCERDFTGLRVALVDDVMTSGASLDALAKAARQAGAADISAWVVARAVER